MRSKAHLISRAGARRAAWRGGLGCSAAASAAAHFGAPNEAQVGMKRSDCAACPPSDLLQSSAPNLAPGCSSAAARGARLPKTAIQATTCIGVRGRSTASVPLQLGAVSIKVNTRPCFAFLSRWHSGGGGGGGGSGRTTKWGSGGPQLYKYIVKSCSKYKICLHHVCPSPTHTHTLRPKEVFYVTNT